MPLPRAVVAPPARSRVERDAGKAEAAAIAALALLAVVAKPLWTRRRRLLHPF